MGRSDAGVPSIRASTSGGSRLRFRSLAPFTEIAGAISQQASEASESGRKIPRGVSRKCSSSGISMTDCNGRSWGPTMGGWR